MEIPANLPINIRDLYTTRLILLIEEEPQSNKYRQIVLTRNQFGIVSDALFRAFGTEPGYNKNVSIEVSECEDRIILPSEIKDYIISKNKLST